MLTFLGRSALFLSINACAIRVGDIRGWSELVDRIIVSKAPDEEMNVLASVEDLEPLEPVELCIIYLSTFIV